MTTGKELYEKHAPKEAQSWEYLREETRTHWERLAGECDEERTAYPEDDYVVQVDYGIGAMYVIVVLVSFAGGYLIGSLGL